MRAVAFDAVGGPEVLTLRDLPDPEPGPGEALVRVKACALNHLDIWVRKGYRHIAVPHVPGSDVAGVVERMGPSIPGHAHAEVRPGDEVVLNPGVSCGSCRACRSGWEPTCDRYELIGARRWGGYAELVKVPAENLLAKPPNLDFPAAASIPLAFLTAWHMVVTRGQLRPAETALVIGAGSGVSAAAIQIARRCGARVIATSSDDAKLERARALGAHETVNHAREDLADAALRSTGGAGVDLVVDHVGKATFRKSLRALARRGRLVTCGETTGGAVDLELRPLFWRQLSIIGCTMGSRAELQDVLALVGRGELVPVVDRVFPLAEAAEAHRVLEAGRQMGKLVLVP